MLKINKPHKQNNNNKKKYTVTIHELRLYYMQFDFKIQENQNTEIKITDNAAKFIPKLIEMIYKYLQI